MKSMAVVVLCLSLAFCHALPLDKNGRVTLDSVDTAASGDANIGHNRFARYGGFGYPYGGYGGYGGYPGGYGGYGGYPGGGLGGGFGGGLSSAYASSSAIGGGFGGGLGGLGGFSG